METKVVVKNTIPYKDAEACAEEIASLLLRKTLGGQIAVDFRRPLFEHYCFAKYFTDMDMTPYSSQEDWHIIYDTLADNDIDLWRADTWSLVQDLLDNIIDEEMRRHKEDISIETNAAKLLKKIEKNISSPLKRDMTEMIIERMFKEEA